MGGLIGINDTWFKFRGSVGKSFNEIKDTGTYMINKSTYPSISGYPPSIIYGILAVFKADSWTLQIASSIENGNSYLRCANEYDKWTDWKQI